MKVDGLSSVGASIGASEPGSDIRAALQVQLLKKSLELQKQQAAEIQQMAEKKGQVLDIRV